jgi:Mg2+ and Co2+ transporter CorA
MKAITFLTMTFIPPTFVATIFSMGFFEIARKATTENSEVELRVAPQIWMYVAVTVPLTVVVIGACAVWLKWNEWRLNDGYGKDSGVQ